MIPYQFNYHRPKSLADAQALLKNSPDAKLLAGGQTLIATMKMRLANPSDLIDISGLKELNYIRVDANAVTIGAAVTHAEVAESAEVRRALGSALPGALAGLTAPRGSPGPRTRSSRRRPPARSRAARWGRPRSSGPR